MISPKPLENMKLYLHSIITINEVAVFDLLRGYIKLILKEFIDK